MNEPTFQDKNKRDSKVTLSYPQIFLMITATILIMVLIGFFVFGLIGDLKLLSLESCKSTKEIGIIPSLNFCFYSGNWDEENYLSTISSFYSTIITVLIAAQAIISWVAFVGIQSSNRRTIENEIEKELPIFFQRKDTDELLREIATGNLQALAKDEIAELAEQQSKEITSYEDKLIKLQNKLENLELLLEATRLSVGIEDGDEPADGRIE